MYINYSRIFQRIVSNKEIKIDRWKFAMNAWTARAECAKFSEMSTIQMFASVSLIIDIADDEAFAVLSWTSFLKHNQFFQASATTNFGKLKLIHYALALFLFRT